MNNLPSILAEVAETRRIAAKIENTRWWTGRNNELIVHRFGTTARDCDRIESLAKEVASLRGQVDRMSRAAVTLKQALPYCPDLIPRAAISRAIDEINWQPKPSNDDDVFEQDDFADEGK